MKKISISLFICLLSSTLFSHCPKTFFKASFQSYNAETRTMVVKQDKKLRTVRIHSKTRFFEMKGVSSIKKDDSILITGCNCQDEWAERIAFAKVKK